MPSVRGCLLAAVAACAVTTSVSRASAQTLPVPPYQTQGAYRVECRQENELVLVIEPAYRAWVDQGRIRGWQFVTADGIPIQGRIGTNVNCRYDLLPANAYPLTAFVNPDAEPAVDPATGTEANGVDQTVTSQSAGVIEVEQLAPPTGETADVPVTADPAPDPFAPNAATDAATDSPQADETTTAEPIELALAAPTITLPPLEQPAPSPTSASQAPTGTAPASPPDEPVQPAPVPATPVTEPQATAPQPTAPLLLAALPALPPDSGSYWVQLGAFETVAEGHLAWAHLLNTAGWSDLATLQPVIQRAAPAPGRVLHRLRVDVHTADRARALCTIQQTAGGECLMVGPGLTPDAWVADIAQSADRPDTTAERVPFADSPMSSSQAVPNWSVP